MSTDDEAREADPAPGVGPAGHPAEPMSDFVTPITDGADAVSADEPEDPALMDSAWTNLFSAEIENVDASDWDVDAALIWGDDGNDSVVDEGGTSGLDFPL